ncbi:hypothetical protein HK097_010050 [Rhizophlyctis rosea]|uniref:Peptidase S8/S53 domain-containing protein n=1 Tax=Rhizophlyctis rosea TaxID=64517 RepID=A0AAD5S9P7_9FUNG|nr:hypothetical protein HK097_010050 [Rhizophlyctis rosea]
MHLAFLIFLLSAFLPTITTAPTINTPRIRYIALLHPLHHLPPPLRTCANHSKTYTSLLSSLSSPSIKKFAIGGPLCVDEADVSVAAVENNKNRRSAAQGFVFDADEGDLKNVLGSGIVSGVERDEVVWVGDVEGAEIKRGRRDGGNWRWSESSSVGGTDTAWSGSGSGTQGPDGQARNEVPSQQLCDCCNGETEQPNPENWALRRIPTRTLPLVPTYTYPPTAGSGIKVYVLDSGINPIASEFDDRVTTGLNTVEAEGNEDLKGHGTFVASLAGGRRFGVAKRVGLVSVKVFDKTGTGTTSDLIRGIEYVVQEFNRTKENSIINISGTQVSSRTLNLVVNGAVSFGVPVFVSASHTPAPFQHPSPLLRSSNTPLPCPKRSTDACEYSPPSAASALTIASTNASDYVSPFSNTGRCIDFFAPGENLTAMWGNGTVQTKSGTSFASPVAAGVMALFWGEEKGLDGKGVTDLVGRNLTEGVVRGIGFFDGARNALVWSPGRGCADCNEQQGPQNLVERLEGVQQNNQNGF